MEEQEYKRPFPLTLWQWSKLLTYWLIMSAGSTFLIGLSARLLWEVLKFGFNLIP